MFVTHDIDEAIKLGDQVAVLRVGGKLAQLATPAELLSRPADAFVAGFVGRDRGYRALGLRRGRASCRSPTNRSSRLGDDAACTPGNSAATAGCSSSTTTDNRSGWLAAAGLADDALRGDGAPELLNLGGTLATDGGHAARGTGRGAVLAERAGRHRATRTAGSPAPSARRRC